MKTEDEAISYPASSSSNIAIAIDGGDGMKKEEEEEVCISNNLVRGVQAAIKKEEAENDNDDDDDHKNNETTQTITPKGIDDNYDDWKKGNWCWLLPANANANAYNNDKTQRQSKSSVTCSTTTHFVKKEDGDTNTNTNNDTTTTATNTAIAVAAATSTNTSIINSRGILRGRRSMSRDDDNDNDNDDEKKPPPKKKMRHCRAINDVVKEEVEDKEEEDSVYEANNNTTNNDNDIGNININSNSNSDEGDDDEGEGGYESWTVGNWCWILPFPPPAASTRRRAVRNRISSRKHSSTVTTAENVSNSGNEDCNYDNDDGDDISSAKLNTRKSTTTYKTRRNERWDEMFQRLVAYKKVHKSTNVPKRYAEDPKLAKWVQTQRTTCGKKIISVKRIGHLDSIGFVWKINDLVPWEEMYKRLIAYKKKHKSTNVPAKYKKDPRLGYWVRHQRSFYNNKTLSIERINRLELIGFVWDPCDAQWMEMYHKLLAYKKQNNSTKVPSLYTKDPSLGLWVSTQRKKYNKGEMSGKRMELLNTINFVWSMMKAS
jgi:hypothetical protein